VRFSRYLVANFLRMLALVLLATIVVFIVIDFVGNIRMWLSRGMDETGEYYLNYLPYIVFLVTPIALMLATVGAVGGMARHLELTAMQSAGRSGLRTLLPIFLLGLIATGGLFVLEETVLPDANYRRLEIAETRMEKKKNPRIKEKSQFVYIGSDKSSWYFRHYSSTSKKGRDVVLLIQKEGRLVERFDARRMAWKNKGWVLENGWHRTFRSDGTLEAIPFRDYNLGRQSRVRPEDLINDRQTGDEMTIQEIRQRIEVLRRSGEDTRKLETQLHFKFSSPLMAFVILLMSTALSHRYSRASALSQKFGVGLLLAFSYYVLIRIGLQMGENGALEPWLGAWVGHIIFGFISLLMLIRSFRL
jgi:lipopolysaccharide export system permease protein